MLPINVAKPEMAEKYSNALFSAWDDAQQSYVFPDTEGYVWLCTEESDESGDYTRMQNDDVFCDGTGSGCPWGRCPCPCR